MTQVQGFASLPAQLKSWIAGYLAVSLLLTALALALDFRTSAVTGLDRTVYAAAAESPPRLLFEDVAHELTLDVIQAIPNLPPRVRVLWRGVWFLPEGRTVDLSARGNGSVGVWVNGQRLLYWQPGEIGVHAAHRTITLPGGFHSFAVEYEHQTGRYGMEVFGDGLTPHRLFRFPTGSTDVWLAWGAMAARAVAAVLWMTPLVILFPLVVGIAVLLGQKPAFLRQRDHFGRFHRSLASALRTLASKEAVRRFVAHRNTLAITGLSIDRERIERTLHKVLPFAFVAFFISGAIYTLEGYRARDIGTFGDWLINYRAGFVRRGLFGEAVYRLYEATGINPEIYVLLALLSTYAIFLLFSYLTLREQDLLPYAFLIFAPFVFMYHDEANGLRKEQIFLAAMALLTWLFQAKPGRTARLGLMVVLCLYPLAVLSHEMLFAWLPYLPAAYILTQPDLQRREVTWIALLSCLSAFCFASLVLYGRATNPEQIFRSLAMAGYSLPANAMYYLDDTMLQSFRLVKNVFGWGNYFEYGLVVPLCALGFLPIRERCGHFARNRICLCLIASSIALTVPVFLFAVDWGRFIRMHAVALFFLSLGCNIQGQPSPPDVPPAHREGRVLVVQAAFFALLFVCYISFWTIPLCCDSSFLLSEPYYGDSVWHSYALVRGWLTSGLSW